jgi:hypothetical protein
VGKTKNSPFEGQHFRHYFTLSDIFVARAGCLAKTAKGIWRHKLVGKCLPALSVDVNY